MMANITIKKKSKKSVFQENCQGITDSITTVTKRCVKESDESLIEGISHKKLRFAEPLPSQAQKENLVVSDVLDADAKLPVKCVKLIFLFERDRQISKVARKN